MDGFKSSPKMQCFKEGGAVKYKSRHSEKSEMSEDIAQDKKVVKKAFAMHDKQSHEGDKTDLAKLKKGGRMKKKDGGCVGRYNYPNPKKPQLHLRRLLSQRCQTLPSQRQTWVRCPQ